jgi:hypothetical protein
MEIFTNQELDMYQDQLNEFGEILKKLTKDDAAPSDAYILRGTVNIYSQGYSDSQKIVD